MLVSCAGLQSALACIHTGPCHLHDALHRSHWKQQRIVKAVQPDHPQILVRSSAHGTRRYMTQSIYPLLRFSQARNYVAAGFKGSPQQAQLRYSTMHAATNSDALGRMAIGDNCSTKTAQCAALQPLHAATAVAVWKLLCVNIGQTRTWLVDGTGTRSSQAGEVWCAASKVNVCTCFLTLPVSGPVFCTALHRPHLHICLPQPQNCTCVHP